MCEVIQMDDTAAKPGQKSDKSRTDEDYIKTLTLAERRGHSRAAPQPTKAKNPKSRPVTELDPSYRARSVDEIAERMGRAQGATESDRAVASTRRAVRKAERTSGDGTDISGTGYTIMKMRQNPIARLVDENKIGPDELMAAEEILNAFSVISAPVACRAQNLNRVDGGGGNWGPWPARLAKEVARFQAWAKHWTRIQTLSEDPMLEVVIAAVVDDRQVKEIALDIGRRHSSVERGLIAGLRDYAARAGFVTGKYREVWISEASKAFTPVHWKLARAIEAARDVP